MKLVGRRSAKATDTDVAHGRPQHVGGVNGVEGYLVALELKCQRVGNARTYHLEADLCALRSAQTAHDVLLRHLNTCNDGVVDADDAVASHDAGFLGRAVVDGLDDQQRVFHDVKLYAYALEIALQRLVHLFHFLGCRVAGVGVELLEHAADAILDQLFLVDAVDIEV